MVTSTPYGSSATTRGPSHQRHRDHRALRRHPTARTDRLFGLTDRQPPAAYISSTAARRSACRGSRCSIAIRRLVADRSRAKARSSALESDRKSCRRESRAPRALGSRRADVRRGAGQLGSLKYFAPRSRDLRQMLTPPAPPSSCRARFAQRHGALLGNANTLLHCFTVPHRRINSRSRIAGRRPQACPRTGQPSAPLPPPSASMLLIFAA